MYACIYIYISIDKVLPYVASGTQREIANESQPRRLWSAALVLVAWSCGTNATLCLPGAETVAPKHEKQYSHAKAGFLSRYELCLRTCRHTCVRTEIPFCLCRICGMYLWLL